MSSKKFIAFDLDDSDENEFSENEILLSGDESTAFKLRGSNKNKFIKNTILMTEQIELINKLRQDTTDLQRDLYTNDDVCTKLEDILNKINTLEQAEHSSLSEKANNLTQSILNIIELTNEKIPAIALKLTPYLLLLADKF